MKSGIYRRSVYFLLVCLVLLTAACSDQKSDEKSTFPYNKDGVLLALPEGWKLYADETYDSGRRTIVVTTHLGTYATVDIFDTAVYDEPLPTPEEYSKEYIQLTLDGDKEALAMAQIDSGEVSRGGSQAIFQYVTLPEPYNVQFMLEHHPKRC